MKLRKGFLSLLIALLMLIILGVATEVRAETATQPLYLGIEQYRSSGLSYEVLEKIMWKISSYSNANGDGMNQSKSYYCIKAGPGFGSQDDMGVDRGGQQIRTYTQKFDFKDKSSITGNYANAIPSGSNYNSLVWVLEHLYIPSIDTDGTYRAQLLRAAGIPSNSAITDDEIDVAQQLAIWYFTNNDEYKITDESFELGVKSKSDADYDSIGNKYSNGDARNDAAIDLFLYLIENGAANANTTPVKSNTVNPVSVNIDNANITLEGQNYILGPYTLNRVVNNIDTRLAATLKNGNNNVSFTILNSNKQSADLNNLIGSQFYISVPASSYASGLKFTLTSTTTESTITYWSVNNAPTSDQPVVEIAKETKPYTLNFLTPNKPAERTFDLSLRKFISEVNGSAYSNNNVLIKEPVVDVSPLVNKTDTTAIYKHQKAPVTVEDQSIVIYTIRVYNEGEIDGYVTQIKDHLPPELQFVNDSFNTGYGWSVSSDGRTVTANITNGKLLKAFDGTTLDYMDIKIKCKVVASSSTARTVITNIADITGFTDSEGHAITDRDSQKDNVTLPSDWQGYKGKDTNKNDLTDSNYYYAGQQDDDDFDKLVIPGKEFDLALRKFISKTSKDGQTYDDDYNRAPNVDVSPLVNNTDTTAKYKHQKAPVGVAIGDEVIYTIRVYNEGEVDGYVTEITDHLPAQLEYVNDEFNAGYGWTVSGDGRTVKTDITSPNTSKSANRDSIYAERTTTSDKVLLKAFNGSKLDYIDVQIKCKVKQVEDLNIVITNIADITGFTDSRGNQVTDRDSQKDNLVLPSDNDLPDYKGNTSNKSILSDSTYHYAGQQDDDDFEKLVLKEFDLALRKFITGVNDTRITNRYPVFTTQLDANGNYIYNHTKEPVPVSSTDLVEYTIRIYNEGNVAGYAKEIKDDIPEGLQFVPTEETNVTYRWKMLDENGNVTNDVTKAKYITTDYLSKEQETTSGRNNLITEFDKSAMISPNYKDVKVVFKVTAPNSHEGIITNTAEISDDSDENGNPVTDRDSTPNNNNNKEDDIDVDHIRLTFFDLALRKFITAVNDTQVTNRIPQFKITEDGKYVYEHTKQPVEVTNGDVVTYTLRIYNEGTINGYASSVKDDIPEGLEYLPEHSTNTQYRWVMLDKDGNQTDDVSKAVSIATDYLSKEQGQAANRDNLLRAFSSTTMDEPDYREIKIAFKVTEPNTSDRIIINKAQIADDQDEEGKPVTDRDSTPNVWNEGEDDQDIEKIKVKYFDLALRKWVTQAIVIENGEEKVTNTGHKAEDDPEEVVKVEIVKSKIGKVVVKFKYSIRVTNEGEIAGYATEISDYIPDGLKFVAADNPDWKESNGKIITTKLANTLLKPGESAEVEVLLTWINGADNMGLKTNVAEISKDKNDSNTPDIDSTPNNKKEGEDDIDDAPVILATKTGELFNSDYLVLTLGSLTILGAGVFFIKKYIL